MERRHEYRYEVGVDVDHAAVVVAQQSHAVAAHAAGDLCRVDPPVDLGPGLRVVEVARHHVVFGAGAVEYRTEFGQRTGLAGYQFKHFLQDNYGEKRIRVIEEDKNGRMWVGTNNGIYIFHPDSLIASPKNYVIYNHANGTFPSNEIRCLMNDDKGNMWIGTSGAGFAVCHPGDSYQHLTFDCYDIKDGLSNAVVQSIVQNKDHKMWIATVPKSST